MFVLSLLGATQQPGSVLVTVCVGRLFQSFYFHPFYIFQSEVCFVDRIYSWFTFFLFLIRSASFYLLIGVFNHLQWTLGQIMGWDTNPPPPNAMENKALLITYS